ncbi:MAG: hypothetical protein R2705_02170 [Ilumatobacteraceae bacterium]
MRCLNEPEVNIIFFEERDDVADAVRAAGVDFYAIRAGVHRFVTSFRTTPGSRRSASPLPRRTPAHG